MSTSVTEASPSAPQRMHLRLVDDADVALALVCGDSDVAVVTAAAGRLDVEQARVITVADRGLDELRQAVTCAEIPTLFVVCRTASFDAAKGRRAVECFGARRVLSHRLLVVQLDPKRPGAWSRTVGKAHAAMRRAHTLASDVPRNPAMVDSADRDAVQGETRGRRMTPAQVLEPGKPLVMVARRAPEAAGGDEDLKSWWRDEVGPIPAHVRTASVRPKLEVVDDSKQTQDDGPASISDADLTRASEDPAVAQTVVSAVVPGRSARIAALAIVILVVLGFAIAPALGASRGRNVDVPTIEPVGLASSIAVIADDPPRSGPVVIVPVAVPMPTIEVAAAPVAQTDDPLARAVADGRVARHAALDVVRGPDRFADWYGAANHCRARSIDGVTDFRLPSVEELRMLRKGDLLPQDPLWSGTRVAGDRGQNWVLEARGTMTAYDKHDDRALIVCVRGR